MKQKSTYGTKGKKQSKYYKDRLIQQRYGITHKEYLEKLIDQNLECEICGQLLWLEGKHTHLDHDKSTGKLRDFLCNRCNLALGLFKHDLKRLDNAMWYLEKHQCSPS